MDSPVLSPMRCRLVPGRGAPKREGEMLTASRARGVIGCREIDAQQPEDRGQEALGLTQRSVEEETERQGGVDGAIGILELPAPPADASRCPRGDRVRREPEGGRRLAARGLGRTRPSSRRDTLSCPSDALSTSHRDHDPPAVAMVNLPATARPPR